MKYALSLAALAAVATAGPITKRAVTDVGILNYALTLEHLEDVFYRQGLANYTQAEFVAAGFADPFYDNLKEISFDEYTHVSFLSTALGDDAVAACDYDFGVSTPAEFVALAAVLEGVGVSAYLGAAASIQNKAYLTDAGSILTVEARHNAYLRAALVESPYPQPFDDPLTFSEVYTLAAEFITACPAANAAKFDGLPLKAFPDVVLGTSGTIVSGQTITLLTPTYVLKPVDGTTPIYAAFITVLGPVYELATPVDGGFTTTVPAGINGQSYVVLTGCADAVNDQTVAAGPAIIEITNPYPSPVPA